MRFYIDPGTGSMLFTILIGILGVGVYAVRNLAIKLRFLFSGGKKEVTTDKIPIAIFTDSKRYWNLFEPICREFDRRGQEVVYMTASPDDPALSCQFDHVKCQFIGEGNKAFTKLNFLKADILISSTPSVEVYQWKRSKDVKYYIHVPHAANDPVLYHMFGLDYYDSVILCGEYQIRQIRQIEALRNLPAKELPVLGITYMDEMKKRLDAAGPLPEHPTTVLLAPSWGSNSIFCRFGGKVIEELLKTGYHVIVRPHPQSYTSDKEVLDRVKAEFPASEQLEWNSDNDNFEVLRRADILISDFSGIIFDFSLVFDKPIIYADTSYDKAPTDACWLEEEQWTFEVLPKIGQQLNDETMPHLKEMIETCLKDPRFQQARDQARADSWAHIGEGTVRTVDYVMDKYRQLQEASSEKETQKV